MQFELIVDNEEVTVITEDGYLACIKMEQLSHENSFIASTYRYQERLDISTMTPENVWEKMEELGMKTSYWELCQFNDFRLVQDALSYIYPDEEEWLLRDGLFPELFLSENDCE